MIGWFRRTPLAGLQWLAIDCETSGLDPGRDRLLSVGAVAVRDGRIDVGDCFHARVKQAMPSAVENILVHGIGGDAQLAGQPLSEVIAGLAARAGEAIPVGFHADFDAAVLRRHGFVAGRRWLDLAALAPVLFPGRAAKGLDDWLAEFGIAVQGRHDALGDAFSTAQLLLVALAEAARQRVKTMESLLGLQRGRRWLTS